MRFKYAEQDMAVYGHNVNEDMASVKMRISQEYDAFSQTLNYWAKLKELEKKKKKASVAEKIHQIDDKLKVEFQLVEQRLSHHRQTLNLLVSSLKKKATS